MTQRKRELLGFTSRSPLEFIDILDKFASDITSMFFKNLKQNRLLIKDNKRKKNFNSL